MASTTTNRRQGINTGAAVKVPCRAATTANITLSGEQTIDGVSCVDGDRVLVKEQNTAADNGIYVVSTSTWQRDKDFDGTFDVVQGTLIPVANGTTNGGQMFRVTTANPITLGTTSLAFTYALDSSTMTYTPTTGALAGVLHTVYSFLNKLGDAGTNLGASLIGFLQSGSGASAATSVQTELRKAKRTSQYDSFAEAVTAAAGVTLIVDSACSVAADVTISGVALRFEQAGTLTPASGVTITGTNTPVDNPYGNDIFKTSSSGFFAGTWKFKTPGLNPMTMVLFGTSIEAQQHDSTAVGPDARGYFNFFNIMAGYPFKPLTNAGTSSNSSAQMLARMNADVIAQKPGWVLVGAPINDPPGSVAYATTIKNMKAMWIALLASGAKVIVSTMYATNSWNASTTLGATEREAQSRYNDAVREFAFTTPGVHFFDLCRAIIDPSTGIPHASPTAVQSDGIHLNYQGGMLAGRALYASLSPVLPFHDQGTPTNFDILNVATNAAAVGDNADGAGGFFLGTGITGQGPNGWSTGRRATGTGVASKVSRSSDWRPETFARMEITCAADRDGAGFYIGGNDILAKGRWDQAWAATTAYNLGDKRRPTVATGYHFFVYTAGTSGGSEPTWPTQEGQFVTDGTVTWICKKTPVEGGQYYAECEIATSSLSGSGVVVLRLDYINTSAATVSSVLCNSFDLSGSIGSPANFLPATGFLRTGLLTIPNLTTHPIRYLRATVFGYGLNGTTFTLDVTRAAIRKYIG